MVQKTEKIKVFCDGGSRGNPGPAAAGVVFTSLEDEILGSFNQFLGEATNNVAEYTAVILALEKMAELGYKNANFYLDSELVVKQLKGEYKVKQPHLRDLYNKIIVLKSGLELNFAHVRREFNKLADEQVNICLDKNI